MQAAIDLGLVGFVRIAARAFSFAACRQSSKFIIAALIHSARIGRLRVRYAFAWLNVSGGLCSSEASFDTA